MEEKTIIKKLIFIVFLTLFISVPFIAFASSTDGTIDDTYKYAWGENIGWFNFGCDNCDVRITDSGLSGYALSENAGWVYLSDVTNDGEGNLSGYAWSENAGWIKFNPTNGGVIINSSGELTGSALGENIGWLIFDGDYVVKTDYRPQSARPACNNSLDDDGDGKTDYPDDPGCSSLEDDNEIDTTPSGTGGGGGGLPAGFYNPPRPPEAGFSVLIQGGADYTAGRTVILKLNGGNDARNMTVSNTADFQYAEQETYQTAKIWTLSGGDGEKTVYVKFYTQYNQPSAVVFDAIILDTIAPEIKITEIKDYYNSTEDIVLIGETESGTEVILKWDEKYGLIHSDNQGKLTINLGKMPVGNYQLEMTPTDLAGNKGKVLTINLIIKPAEALPRSDLGRKTEREIVPKKSKEPIIKIIEKVPEILKPLIPEFLKPEEEKKPEEIIVIPEQTPLAMRGQWNLLPKESIRSFVLAPLPKEIRKLAEKFPEFEQTLKKVGITKITDVEKLKAVKLTLPGLTQRVGLPTAKVEAGKFALPAGIPVVELSPEMKKQIPSEIVFAKAGGELIDFNIALSVSEKGEPQQKIATISGKSLQLVVKPDQPVKSVKGYVVFKSKKPRETSLQFPFNNLTASLIFTDLVLARPAKNEPLVFIEGSEPKSDYSKILASLAEISNNEGSQEKPVKIEERLVLLEFEYTDPDGDGIYTAEIQAPLVEGEYEIITIMDFKEPELEKKEIRLIAVIDPEGYVYEKDGDKETRVPGAIISIYWLNPETKQYELWPAGEYQQENPQITNVTGKYSFLVPEGDYYLKAEAPGYLVYDGKPFQVREGSGVHVNIELKTKHWWLKIVDWKTVLLAIVIILLLYNFYRDKIREKLLRK